MSHAARTYQDKEAAPMPRNSASVKAHLSFINSLPEPVIVNLELNNNLNARIEQQRFNFQNTSHAFLSIRDLLEAENAGEFFASLFPDPLRAKLGIMELLINAIEHGNLEITSEEKMKLIRENRWIDEIMHRLNTMRYSRRRVHIFCTRQPHYVEILIKDEGRGFDWKTHLRPAKLSPALRNGHGISCANFIGFDQLEYIGSGYMVKGRQYYKD